MPSCVPKILVRKTQDGRWSWKLKGKNGKVLAQAAKPFTDKQALLTSLSSLLDNLGHATVVYTNERIC